MDGPECNNKNCWSIKLHYNVIAAHSWACRFRFKTSDAQLSWVICASAVHKCSGQMSSSIVRLMYRGDSVLTWWLYGHQIWGELQWVSDCCTLGVRAEIIIGLWSVNSIIAWPSPSIFFPPHWHWWMRERLKSTWRWRRWQLMIHSLVVTFTPKMQEVKVT